TPFSLRRLGEDPLALDRVDLFEAIVRLVLGLPEEAAAGRAYYSSDQLLGALFFAIDLFRGHDRSDARDLFVEEPLELLPGRRMLSKSRVPEEVKRDQHQRDPIGIGLLSAHELEGAEKPRLGGSAVHRLEQIR